MRGPGVGGESVREFHETADWFGAASPWKPEIWLQVEGDTLNYCFRAQKTPLCDEKMESGSFVEGLWEKDVAELFLSGPGESYQEINISPTGAWWSALFRGYRERSQTVEFPVEIEVERADNFWQVSFSTAVENLDAWSGLQRPEYRASPTAILHGPEPSFFAWNWNPNKDGEPDFHRKDLLKPLSWNEQRMFWP
jgi:hypothetical protein